MGYESLRELKAGALCFQCVGEAHLSQLIRMTGKASTCLYCRKRRKAISLEDIAGHVHGAFERHYERTPQDMDGFEYAMHKDPEISYSWERSGQPTADAIAEAADVSSEMIVLKKSGMKPF